ncbi:MAG: ABC transporter permease [Desulfovibrionaceae bacterium]
MIESDFMLGIKQAAFLIFTGNTEVYNATLATIESAFIALSIAAFFSIPCAIYLAFSHSTLSKIIQFITDTLLALPTVLIGLLCYILFSKQGILASLSLLYTVTGMGIALSLLAFPLLTSLITSALKHSEESLSNTLLTLGASSFQKIRAFLWESRIGVTVAFISTISRVISEVGIAMMIGGNIKNYTRTLTTSIALETGKGDFSLAIAFGIMLLILAIILNLLIRLLRKSW